MSKKLLVVASTFALLASACAKQPSAEMTLGAGKRFVPQVVDSITDVGRNPSVLLDADGNPLITYLGFNSIAKSGEIPESRPVALPPVPGVMTASLSDGRWTISGVEAPDDKLTTDDDTGATVPLDDASASSVLDPEGNLHVVWVDSGGLKYAAGSGGRYTVDTVAKGTNIMGPAVAVDAAGEPWVSYYDGNSVMVAVKLGGWTSYVVARPGSCDKYCAATRTAIVVSGSGPVVGYRDGGAAVSTQSAEDPATWTSVPVGSAGGGLGTAMTVTKSGEPVMSYLGTSGEVTVASYDGAKFTTMKVSTVDASTPSSWVTTGVAVDESGTRYVTWYDPKTDQVKLASDSRGSFGEIATQGTDGGASPSVAVTPDGSRVWIAWYDHENGNLQAGGYGLQDVVLAKASPLPAISLPAEAPTGAPSPASSGPTSSTRPTVPTTGKSVTLKLVAPAGSVASGFDKTGLSAPANTAIELIFDNQDPGVPHNVEIWTADPLKDPSATAIFTPEGGATITGPDRTTYSVPPMDAGTYFYRCLIHPTTMTGTLTVK